MGEGPGTVCEQTTTLVAVTTDAVEMRCVERVIRDGKEQPAGEPTTWHLSADTEEWAVLCGGWMRRTGTRDVTVAGKTLHCDVYEGLWPGCCTGRDGTVVTRTCDEVPGGDVEDGSRADNTKPDERVLMRLTAFAVK